MQVVVLNHSHDRLHLILADVLLLMPTARSKTGLVIRYVLLLTVVQQFSSNLTQGQTTGTIRLLRNNVTYPTFSSGRLQLYLNNQWGNVCGDRVASPFSLISAGVVCRQLGYIGASATTIATEDSYGYDTSPALIDDVNCGDGSTADRFLVLLRCSYSSIIDSQCTDDDDVGVSCYLNRLWDDPFSGMVRLVNGTYSSEGVVEVYCERGDDWATVCGGAAIDDGNTICRQLGYKGAETVSSRLSISGSQWFSNLSCVSSQSCVGNCQSCPELSVPPHSCTHDLYVECHYNLPTTKEGSERHDCTADYYPRGEGAVRLARSSRYSPEYAGRVQVYYNSIWGNVCRLGGFNSTAADVICHQTGWSGASDWSYSAADDFPVDARVTHFDDILCSDSSLLVLQQCSYSTSISTSCTDDDDVSVTCYSDHIWDNPFNSMVRLTDTNFVNEGRVEVYCNGQWGTVCDNNFGANDARAICRQLGYNDAFSTSALTISPLNSSIPIWLDNLNCFAGSDFNCIRECQMCSSVPSSDPDCLTHLSDASVQCFIDETSPILSQTLDDCQVTTQGASLEGSLILRRGGVDSSAHSSGTVVIYHNGRWGNICRLPTFTSAEADVICHQMTYSGASSWGHGSDSTFSLNDSRSAVISDMRCSIGFELTALQCLYSDTISSDCDDSQDISVWCYSSRIWDNPYSGMVRLMGGDFTNEGRVEIYCLGQWGTMCGSTFGSDNSGEVICRQLGYDTVSEVNYITLPGNSSSNIWLNNLRCFSSLSMPNCVSQCRMCPTAKPSTSCTHEDDATIRCAHSLSTSSSTDSSSVSVPFAPGGLHRSCLLDTVVPGGAIDGSMILERNGVYSSQFNSGKVIVRLVQAWFSICSYPLDPFGNMEADVICHQLQYSGASSWSWSQNTSLPITKNLRCEDSNLLTISQCTLNIIAETRTNLQSCVINPLALSVTCYETRIWDNPFDGMIRLFSGDEAWYSNEGRLEVYCNGEWGLVCSSDTTFGSSSFSTSAARAACRQLGYEDYQKIGRVLSLSLSALPLKIWFDEDLSSTCINADDCLTDCFQCPSSEVGTCVQSDSVFLKCRSSIMSINDNVVKSCDYSTSVNIGAIVGGTVGGIGVLIIVTIICVITFYQVQKNKRCFTMTNPIVRHSPPPDRRDLTTATDQPLSTANSIEHFTTPVPSHHHTMQQEPSAPHSIDPLIEPTPSVVYSRPPPPPYNPNVNSESTAGNNVGETKFTGIVTDMDEKPKIQTHQTGFIRTKEPPPYDPNWEIEYHQK